MQLNSIKDAEVGGKRALVRCGFDVPFDDQGEIAEDERIRECIPTIKFLIDNQAKVIIASHNGRPKGEIVPKLSMDKIAERIEKLLGIKIKVIKDSIGEEVQQAVAAMNNGDVLLLENLRFYKGEEDNDPNFAKRLAAVGDLYVNESFSVSHRDHASITGVTAYLPAYAGFRLEKEVATLSKVMDDPERPMVAVIGGAKISDKIKVIKRFLEVADHVILGGALANTILKAQGISVGKSIVDDSMIEFAGQLPLTSTKLHVPVDVVVAHEISDKVKTYQKAVGNVGDDEIILDIGPDTVKLFKMIIKESKTIVWGGPMGYFEIKAFSKGTKQIAKEICKSKAMSVAGGGDTAEALKQAGCKDKISFVSTGGGAMLEFLEGKLLPGLKPLIKK